MNIVFCKESGVNVFLILLLILVTGCNFNKEERIRNLIFDENSGFKSVLDLYKNDSLKYQAALFLIDNLAYYRGVAGNSMKSTYKAYEVFSTGKYTYQQALDSAYKVCGKLNAQQILWEEDIDMNPAYLVSNIEWAFKVWKEQPWGKNVSFSQFCEYILPYRVGNEELIPWREKLYYEYMPIIEKYLDDPNIEKPTFAAHVILDSLLKVPFYFTGEMSSDIRIGPRIVEWRGGSCLDLCDMLVYIYRALGIPCGIEELPLRGNNNAPHYWNFIEDDKGQTWYFSMFYWWHRLLEAEKYGDKYGKVFRHRFSLNRNMVDSMQTVDFKIYPSFRFPFFEDVTKLYATNKAHTLSINYEYLVDDVKEGDLIYLCMSNRTWWKPVDWNLYNGEDVIFKNCHGGTIFCLAVYDFHFDMLKMISDPFSVDEDNGKICFYTPDDQTEDVVLYSKFGMIGEFFIERMVNGVFEGSNSLLFDKKDTLFQIKRIPNRLCTTIWVNTHKKYRYVRYKGADGSFCNISEVGFYERFNDSIPLSGTIIGAKDGREGSHSYFKAIDGSTESSYDHPHADGGWVGLDLKQQKHIEKIVYTPRNRDNFIRNRDVYELFFCDKGVWKSLGLQNAKSDSLLYKNVPKHALLLLRNHSRGVAERLFEYKDGVQIFW